MDDLQVVNMLNHVDVVESSCTVITSIRGLLDCQWNVKIERVAADCLAHMHSTASYGLCILRDVPSRLASILSED
ncbi:hypothetical protein J1N35_020720 [Gossypium stocksii]|uniref:Uncharacterized protein n=1 Tax=Gossypium stocksii TaxID=47602 RepID=A0A9D3VFD7_9ROSI|nr:hypothetical protein J1N35_020720 [Gossypium stocksii]